jgi:hypothetical protein
MLVSYWKQLSKFERIFWGTIGAMFIVWLSISMIAFDKMEEKKSIILELFSTDKAKENLTEGEALVNESLNSALEKIYKRIDTDIDLLFENVENNVDKFLDFHYSVKGEYTELGTMAFGDIEKLIEKQLFGDRFHEEFKKHTEGIETEYKNAMQQLFDDTKKIAFEDIDFSISENNEAIKRLNDDIKQNFLLQETKIYALIAGGIAIKIAATLSAKIAATAATKGTVKAGSKAAAKMVAAGTGATAGLACGPFAWVCSPAAAVTLWVATDVAVVKADEHFTRDAFKQEILSLLEEHKQNTKDSFKASYYEELKEFSHKAEENIKETPLKEKRQVKKIFKGK